MFQSLLSWKYNQILLKTKVDITYLLSFNPCYLGNTIRSLRQVRCSIQKSCFNPCYLGNTIRSFFALFIYIIVTIVSILVILEIQSDLDSWAAGTSVIQTVSILVILEIQSDQSPEFFRLHFSRKFQSLLSWKYNQIGLTQI